MYYVIGVIFIIRILIGWKEGKKKGRNKGRKEEKKERNVGSR